MTSVFRKTRSRPAGLRLAALLALALSLGACAPVTQIATSSTEAATVRQTELARNLYELAYSDRQSALFVVSAGSGRVEPIVPPRIYRLNPETLEAQAHIDLPRMGTGLALDDGNGRLYVSSPLDASVSVLDTRSNALAATLQLAQGSTDAKGVTRYPHKLRKLLVDAPGKRLYALGAGLRDSALYVVDTQSLQLVNVVPGLGTFATGIALDPQGNRLYVSNMEGRIIVLDAQSQQRLQEYPAHADQPLNLAFDQERGHLILTDQGQAEMRKIQQTEVPGFVSQGEGSRVVILDARTGRLVHSAAVPEGPLALHLDAAHGLLYVTHRLAGTVSVLDSRTLSMLHSYALPEHPNSLSMDASGSTLFVTVKNDMTTGRLRDETVARIPAPL